MKKKYLNLLKGIIITISILVITTGIGYLFHHFQLHKTNIVVLYIFSVLIISRYTKGFVYGIVASIVSFLLFNWFFTEPYFTLKVDDPTYIFTFAIMTLTSILTSALTTEVKKTAEKARKRENETNAIYQLTNFLTDAEDADAIGEIITNSIVDTLGCEASFVPFNDKGVPQLTYLHRTVDKKLSRLELNDPQEIKRRISNLHEAYDDIDDIRLYPIYGKTSTLGVLSIPRAVGESISQSQNKMMHSIIESAALALERLKSLKAQAKSREEATQERYRSNLLRAISHDIRTPLSGIMGTSEMLMAKTRKSDVKYSMAMDIYQDALWLHGLVENILNLTKLQDGKINIEKQPEALEEVISAALMVIEKRCPDRVINVDMPNNVIIAPMNAKLISQVIVNLLDNAAKHTPNNKKISIKVSVDNKNAIVSILDEGTGIRDKDLPYIFQMFYTSRSKVADSKRGVGLGLTICQSIIEAHGGKITAENRKKEGACFTFTLPLKGGKKHEQ